MAKRKSSSADYKCGTAFVIAWQAVVRYADPREIAALIGMAAMAFAAMANLLVIRYLSRISKITQSAALSGESEHLRGDLLASLGVLAGLAAYQITGWQAVDPLIAILFVCIGIVFAVRQLSRVVHDLMDGSLPPHEIK